MEYLFLGILIFLLLLVLLVYLYNHNKPHDKKLFMNPFASVFPSSDNTQNNCVSDQTQLEFPLIYDSRNGIYRSDIRLGSSGKSVLFSVVPDSGSSLLIVSGNDCPNCPKNDGIWDPSIGTKINGLQGTIKYGGGQVTHYLPWQAALINNQTGQNYDTVVNFGVITNTVSPDNVPLNVLGLQNKSGSFLNSLCGEKTVIFDFPQNKLYLGKSDNILQGQQNQQLKIVKMAPPVSSVAFPLGTILQMKIDGKIVPDNTRPKLGVFDTGTTDTFVSDSLFPLIQNGSSVEITFQGINNANPTIIFKNSSNMISKGATSVPNSILIGNYWLRQYGVGFKYDDQQIVLF